jgi:hypothetical protein
MSSKDCGEILRVGMPFIVKIAVQQKHRIKPNDLSENTGFGCFIEIG